MEDCAGNGVADLKMADYMRQAFEELVEGRQAHEPAQHERTLTGCAVQFGNPLPGKIVRTAFRVVSVDRQGASRGVEDEQAGKSAAVVLHDDPELIPLGEAELFWNVVHALKSMSSVLLRGRMIPARGV